MNASLVPWFPHWWFSVPQLMEELALRQMANFSNKPTTAMEAPVDLRAIMPVKTHSA